MIQPGNEVGFLELLDGAAPHDGGSEVSVLIAKCRRGVNPLLIQKANDIQTLTYLMQTPRTRGIINGSWLAAAPSQAHVKRRGVLSISAAFEMAKFISPTCF